LMSTKRGGGGDPVGGHCRGKRCFGPGPKGDQILGKKKSVGARNPRVPPPPAHRGGPVLAVGGGGPRGSRGRGGALQKRLGAKGEGQKGGGQKVARTGPPQQQVGKPGPQGGGPHPAGRQCSCHPPRSPRRPRGGTPLFTLGIPHRGGLGVMGSGCVFPRHLRFRGGGGKKKTPGQVFVSPDFTGGTPAEKRGPAPRGRGPGLLGEGQGGVWVAGGLNTAGPAGPHPTPNGGHPTKKKPIRPGVVFWYLGGAVRGGGPNIFSPPPPPGGDSPGGQTKKKKKKQAHKPTGWRTQ